MGGFFRAGEEKIRPGVYHRYTNTTVKQVSYDGVVAVTIRSNWGPVEQLVELDRISDIYTTFGDGGANSTLDALKQIFKGGASTIYAVRVGNGGTKATATLKDSEGIDAVKITAKSPGSRALSYTVRPMIGNAAYKVMEIYDGTNALETLSFEAGTKEADTLVAAGKWSKLFDFEKVSAYAGNKELKSVQLTPITAGTDPAVTADEYNTAFTLFEPYRFNCLCVDTEDTAIVTLLQAYVNQAYEGGKNIFGVVGQKTTKMLVERQTEAKGMNDYNMVYVGDGWAEGTDVYDGYVAAARVAGIIAATPSNQSVTHIKIEEASGLSENLKNSDIEDCINSGMVIFTTSSENEVWIESGVTTLVKPESNDDDGWKKIKRTKVRFELLTRADIACEGLIAKVGNDTDGRSTIITAIQGICNAMVQEGKIYDGAVVEIDPDNQPRGDSAWFNITVDDIDTLEKVYLNYNFRFTSAA